VPFAFLDYGKAGWQVFLENLLMLWFWAFAGMQTALILQKVAKKREDDHHRFLPAAAILASVVIGVLLLFVLPAEQGPMTFGREIIIADNSAFGKVHGVAREGDDASLFQKRN
jgi:Ni/Fe-hydrogenase subunit HybB-like protein